MEAFSPVLTIAKLKNLPERDIIKVSSLKKGIHSGALRKDTDEPKIPIYEYMDELAEANHLSLKDRNNLQEGDYLVVSYYGDDSVY